MTPVAVSSAAVSLLLLGAACCVLGLLRRRTSARDANLAALLDLPGEPLVETGRLSTLQLGRIVAVLGLSPPTGAPEIDVPPDRPAELGVIAVVAGGLAIAVAAITGNALVGVALGVAVVVFALTADRRRARKRRQVLEEQFPEALAVVAGALESGNPLTRSLQILAESGAQVRSRASSPRPSSVRRSSTRSIAWRHAPASRTCSGSRARCAYSSRSVGSSRRSCAPSPR
jgi:hypothetical protein